MSYTINRDAASGGDVTLDEDEYAALLEEAESGSIDAGLTVLELWRQDNEAVGGGSGFQDVAATAIEHLVSWYGDIHGDPIERAVASAKFERITTGA